MTYSFALTRPKMFLAGAFFIVSLFLAMAMQAGATTTPPSGVCPPGTTPEVAADGTVTCNALGTPQYTNNQTGTATIARIINIDNPGNRCCAGLVISILWGSQSITRYGSVSCYLRRCPGRAYSTGRCGGGSSLHCHSK